MKCYYSNRDCDKCTKKRNCPIVKAWLDQKAEIDRLEELLERAEMMLEPPERSEKT